jgi:hypothetical protein
MVEWMRIYGFRGMTCLLAVKEKDKTDKRKIAIKYIPIT